METTLPGQCIMQKLEECTCGCKGRDAQHKEVIRRAVHNLEFFEEPQETVLPALRSTKVLILARGTYKVEGTRFKCGYWIVQRPNGEWWSMGWARITE
jgi:hypothetical protein